jgi:hypothetical protein
MLCYAMLCYAILYYTTLYYTTRATVISKILLLRFIECKNPTKRAGWASKSSNVQTLPVRGSESYFKFKPSKKKKCNYSNIWKEKKKGGKEKTWNWGALKPKVTPLDWILAALMTKVVVYELFLVLSLERLGWKTDLETEHDWEIENSEAVELKWTNGNEKEEFTFSFSAIMGYSTIFTSTSHFQHHLLH